ncbi:MAG TPA: thiamine pyrophosphate-dependent dehydrogenase E1 component subunit alpha [Gammaproteobacteria bacterium]|nr:thiamine pyrophosphate-dependent dehydrogenase E1 component subunit alpha [Gammaproteobacteria bacterium]
MATALSVEDLLDAYRTMKTIRDFEERVHVEFAKGGIPGFVHLYAGEEASATGVCMNLRDDDYIASNHRGHGHCIAKGVDVHGMMAEIYGKRSGTCHGKGGSMHIADLDAGMMGANGIVGGGPPLVCGAALTAKMKGNGGVALAFFGDGASNQGTTFESLNLATVWKLPCVFVAENNGYAEATASSWSVSCEDISMRAKGFGMPGITIDGHDFFAVHEATQQAVERARGGGGPTLIECKLDRFFGHFEGDNQSYRAANEVKEVRANKDCIKRFATTITADTEVTDSDLVAIDDEVKTLIDDAVAKAIADGEPGAADLLTDVYINY